MRQEFDHINPSNLCRLCAYRQECAVLGCFFKKKKKIERNEIACVVKAGFVEVKRAYRVLSDGRAEAELNQRGAA